MKVFLIFCIVAVVAITLFGIVLVTVMALPDFLDSLIEVKKAWKEFRKNERGGVE